MENEKTEKIFTYFIKGKRVEEELTYEKFVKLFSSGLFEFGFKYNEVRFDLAYHFEKKQIFELNISDCNGDSFQYFDSPESLLKNGLINGKTIKSIWHELI